MIPEESGPAERPPQPPVLQAPVTRREMFLFGLLLLAIVWAFASRGPRTVVVVPDTHMTVGIIT
jgi:hypothetical protein